MLELFLGLLVALAGIDGLLRDYVWLLFAQDTRFLRRKHSRWWRLPSRGKRTSITGYWISKLKGSCSFCALT